jgi:hypothetical protein
MGTTNGVHHVNGAAKAPIRVAIVGGGIGGLALALGELDLTWKSIRYTHRIVFRSRKSATRRRQHHFPNLRSRASIQRNWVGVPISLGGETRIVTAEG